MKSCEITLDISEQGVTRVQIHADSADEQGAAHILLAAVAPEMRQLDEALKGLGQRPAVEKGSAN
jgi:hypothetical protein